MTASASDVQGILIQEIPQARIVQQFNGDQDVDVAKGTLRVLMVSIAVDEPSSNEKAQASASANPLLDSNTDIWLALEVGQDFSLAVKSSQTVIPDRKTSSYLFPSSEVPGAVIRLSFDTGNAGLVHEFEELLCDYCAFQSDDAKGHGSLELLDEKGDLLGNIDGPWQLKEDAAMHAPGHEKDPVMLELPDEKDSAAGADQLVSVSNAPRDEHGHLPDAYQNDWLLRGAHFVSRSMEKGSAWAGSSMLKVADSYIARNTPPPGTPENKSGRSSPSDTTASNAPSASVTASGHEALTFRPETHTRARSVRNVSGKVCSVSNRTTAAVLGAASSLGEQIGKRTGIQQKQQADGTVQQPKGVRGALNRSLIAFNVVLDGVTNSAERLLKDGGEAGSRMIEHRYGSEAKVISGNVASVGRSAFVVYKDINGVRRKALLKVATGTIKARAPDGSEVVLQQLAHDASVRASMEKDDAGAMSSTAAIEPPPYDSSRQQASSSASMSEKR